LIAEYGYCISCHNNPAFFDDGLCHHCFNYCMHDLTDNDIIMIIQSYINRMEKNPELDKFDRLKYWQEGIARIVYGGNHE